MEPGTYIMNKRQIAKVQYLYNAKMRGREMAEAAELLRQKTPEEIAEIKRAGPTEQPHVAMKSGDSPGRIGRRRGSRAPPEVIPPLSRTQAVLSFYLPRLGRLCPLDLVPG